MNVIHKQRTQQQGWMTKLRVTGALFLVAFSVAGCSSFGSGANPSLAPGEIKVRMTDSVNGANLPAAIRTKYTYGEMVYAYVTLGWDDTLKIKQLDVKWYNAEGALVSVKSNQLDHKKNPHHAWFWINSAQLGKGTVHAEILADGKVISNAVFKVLDVPKKTEQVSWYKRIFTSDTGAQKPADSVKVIEPNLGSANNASNTN